MVQCDIALFQLKGIVIGTAMDSPEAKRASADWIPSALASSKGVRYLAVVDALEADITSGSVQPGARLLPQREILRRSNAAPPDICRSGACHLRHGPTARRAGPMVVTDRSHTECVTTGG